MTPTPIDTLKHAVASMKALDLTAVAAAELVPLMKAIQDVCAAQAAIHAEIERRAIGNGEMLPGVVVKDAITHRAWNDVEAATPLAFEAFGLKAFKLVSPAAIEKLGDEGKALVAVASTKPEAGKRVVY